MMDIVQVKKTVTITTGCLQLIATTPQRPTVNWEHAPAYKLTKFFTNLFNQIIILCNASNTKNTPELFKDLNEISLHPNIRLTSFDILNMYANIPIVQH
jgi:hypothetical protein